MSAKFVFIATVALIKITNSQYYGQPTSSYQPYNYYPVSTPPVSPSMYATPTIPPTYPIFAPPQFSTPAFAPTIQSITSPYGPSMFAPSVYTSTYPSPTSYTNTKSPTYSPRTQSKQTSGLTPNSALNLATPKCTPPTATAYYLTSEAPKVKTEKVKENLKTLPPPTYPCPFCTGFANVPKNSKIQPPPPCSSVLPGVLDKISTITIPDELKIKDISKLNKPSSFDLFEHKLSGKLRFDQDLLDGFLTGLGLGKINDL